MTDSTVRGIDTHCHVFVDEEVPRTPLVEGAAYEPPRVDVGDHARELAASGCDRGVLVQPSAYGEDHACLLAALRRRPEALRGVVCAGLDTPAETLHAMHGLGVRATRVQDGYPGGVPVEALVEMGEAVAGLGWHLELWTDLRRHADWIGEAVRRCPVPVVFDHLGYVPSDVEPDHPALRTMLELLAEGHAWVALTGSERLFPGPGDLGADPGADPGDPDFAERWRRHEEALAARVEACVAANPDQLLWGTDWPHVGVRLPLPGSAALRERLERWVPDEQTRARILVDNPRRRYEFTG